MELTEQNSIPDAQYPAGVYLPTDAYPQTSNMLPYGSK